MRNFLWTTLCFGLLIGTQPCHAQNINPSSDLIFNSNTVARLLTTMNQGAFDSLYAEDNRFKDDYYRADFVYVNENTDTLIKNIGIRFRGNTSRNHPKKSFKIDFKEFGGSKFFDHKKFNLKADNNDPTLAR
ncbi:MAG: spore coat protein H [Bacteroidia bacterium]|jgi:spore coat protein H